MNTECWREFLLISSQESTLLPTERPGSISLATWQVYQVALRFGCSHELEDVLREVGLLTGSRYGYRNIAMSPITAVVESLFPDPQVVTSVLSHRVANALRRAYVAITPDGLSEADEYALMVRNVGKTGRAEIRQQFPPGRTFAICPCCNGTGRVPV